MSDTRSRFEEWWDARTSIQSDVKSHAWDAYQAAEAQAVRRCVEITEAQDLEAIATLLEAHGFNSYAEGVRCMGSNIRAAFPHAFKE